MPCTPTFLLFYRAVNRCSLLALHYCKWQHLILSIYHNSKQMGSLGLRIVLYSLDSKHVKVQDDKPSSEVRRISPSQRQLKAHMKINSNSCESWVRIYQLSSERRRSSRNLNQNSPKNLAPLIQHSHMHQTGFLLADFFLPFLPFLCALHKPELLTRIYTGQLGILHTESKPKKRNQKSRKGTFYLHDQQITCSTEYS